MLGVRAEAQPDLRLPGRQVCVREHHSVNHLVPHPDKYVVQVLDREATYI